MRACSALWVVVLTLFVSYSLGQTGTSSVRGIVLDRSGAAVAGAKVTVSNNGQALQRETQTDDSGEYHFLALPPGATP
jgi:protocatechuate 3,4-dioxygenase beta subunit